MSIAKLAELAKNQPQNAYAALTKSLQCEWNYVQRVTQDNDEIFEPLAEALSGKFIRDS